VKTLKYNGHKIRYFDSIIDLPIRRFQLYNLYVAMDSEIGSDVDQFDQKALRLSKLIATDPKAAQLLLANMRQSIRFIMGNISPKMKAFAVLVYSIDGEPVEESDLAGDGIEAIIDRLNKRRFSFGMLVEALKSVKKNFSREFETFFPSTFDDARTKEVYTRLKERAKLILQTITGTVQDAGKRIEELEEYILTAIKPRQFAGKDGAEVQALKRFEETCIFLAQQGVSDNPRAMTTLAFYQALDLLQQQAKKNARQYQTRKK